MSSLRVIAAAFFAFLTCAPQASAVVYNWTYSGDGYHSGSGTLTTTGATSPFTIIEITGTFDGYNILKLLEPRECCGIPGASNLLYSPPSTLLDGNGLAFETGGRHGFYNILFFHGAYSVLDDNGVLTSNGTFTATQAPRPGPSIPEPASLSMIVAGFVCLAALNGRKASGARRRDRPVTITYWRPMNRQCK